VPAWKSELLRVLRIK